MVEGLELTITENEGKELINFAKQYKQLMMVYESGIKQITTKLEILNKEYKVKGERNPIESVKSRLKSPESIAGKLERKGLDISIPSITENLNDIAGVRVICPYISDIYLVRDMLLAQADVRLISEKDYIENPKVNGYRSLHIVVEIPVYLSSSVYPIKVEIQIRTIAMDFWASLEHQIRYKTSENIPPGVEDELFECAQTIAQTDKKMEAIARKIRSSTD